MEDGGGVQRVLVEQHVRVAHVILEHMPFHERARLGPAEQRVAEGLTRAATSARQRW